MLLLYLYESLENNSSCPQIGESAAFVRSDDPNLFGSDKYQIEDETSGPNAPDLELLGLTVGVVEHTVSPLIPCPAMTLVIVGLRLSFFSFSPWRFFLLIMHF